MNTHQLAQIRNPVLPPEIGGGINPNPDAGLSAAGGFIGSIASVVFIIAIVAAFLYFLLGGIQWITSGGDKSHMEAARNKITHAIVGLLIIASSWAVWILVGNFLGIDVKRLPFPTIIRTSSVSTPSIPSGTFSIP